MSGFSVKKAVFQHNAEIFNRAFSVVLSAVRFPAVFLKNVSSTERVDEPNWFTGWAGGVKKR